VCRHLNLSLGRAVVGKFSDGEVMVELLENVRGRDVFVLQSTCQPTNDNLMEVMVMVDALKRASATRITAALPYFGYARQDRRPRSARVAISAKVVADMLSTVGVDRVMVMDLHADQIQGFFNIPVDNVYATPILLGDLWKRNYDNLLIVSPDVGGVVRARAIAKRLDSDLAIIDKRRPKANVAEVMNIIGDVEGRTCVIMDDIVDTANTLCKAATALKEHGAAKVVAYCTHPVLSGGAVARIASSDMDEIVVTDTIPLTEEAKACLAHPAAVVRAADRRDDDAHQQRGIRVLVVHRLKGTT
jgi:ribose-phosphate pyrophosphokinase